MARQRYGTPRQPTEQTRDSRVSRDATGGRVRQTPRQTTRQTTRQSARQATRRNSRKKPSRGWPQILVIVGVVALVAIGVALMMRPKESVQQGIYPVEYREAILESCERHNVSPQLVCAIIKCESNWREDVESAAGAVGLMQVMPSTASSLVGLGYVDEAAYPSENLADPLINIEYGCATLDFLQHQFENEEEVIAAYNAGVGTVQNWLAAPGASSFKDRISYPETLAYLNRVLDALANYEILYDDGLKER